VTDTKWEKNISVVTLELFSFRVKAILIGQVEGGICEIDREVKVIYTKYSVQKILNHGLTRLRRLNRTSFLPSSCNLDKIFALTGHLAQVHTANKKFPIFLHAGMGKRKRER
jgi:hypothetical protein